jgi:hypothetical protein
MRIFPILILVAALCGCGSSGGGPTAAVAPPAPPVVPPVVPPTSTEKALIWDSGTWDSDYWDSVPVAPAMPAAVAA